MPGFINTRAGAVPVEEIMKIETAIKNGHANLSEYESKLFLSSYGIPVTKEILIKDQGQIVLKPQWQNR